MHDLKTVKSLRSEPPVRGRNLLEEDLHKRCVNLLSIDPRELGIKDNLLEEGFKSIDSTRFLSDIANKENGYGVQISYADFVEKYRTIETLAAYIRCKRTIAPADDLRIKKNGQLKEDKPLVWCFHDATGKIDAYKSACDIIKDKVLLGCEVKPVPKVDHSPVPETKEAKLAPEPGLCQTLEDMAIYWIEVIRSRQPIGPYELVGYSFGASLAQKVAYMLQQQGEIVSSLYLIDAVSPKTLQDFPNDEHADYVHKVVGLLFAILNARYIPFYTINCKLALEDLRELKLSNIQQVRKIFEYTEVGETSEKERDPKKPRRLKLQDELEIIKINLLAPFLEGEPTGKVTESCRTQLYYTPELAEIFQKGQQLPPFGWNKLCKRIWMRLVDPEDANYGAINHTTIMGAHVSTWAQDIQSTISPPGPIPTSPLESKSPSKSKNLFAADFQLAQPAITNNPERQTRLEVELRLLREEQRRHAKKQEKQLQVLTNILQTLVAAGTTPPASPLMSKRALPATAPLIIAPKMRVTTPTVSSVPGGPGFFTQPSPHEQETTNAAPTVSNTSSQAPENS